MKKLSWLAWILLSTPMVRAEPAISLIERIQSDLAQDKAFSPEERVKYLQEFRHHLGGYAFDLLKGTRPKAAEVVMTLVMKGSFDRVPIKTTVGVATTAYVAISRGAPAEFVEGIALYGFRKKLGADSIAAWANGVNDCIRFGLPLQLAKELVFQAAEHGWATEEFNIYKWGLIKATQSGYDPKDFCTYLFGYIQKRTQRPGALVSQALRVFRKAYQAGVKPKLPSYQSPLFSMPLGSNEAKAQPKTIAPSFKRPDTRKRKLARLASKLDASIRSYLGTPFVWGGRNRKGADCSGFVQAVFAELGLSLPRSTEKMWQTGSPVHYDQLKKGDLVFFRTVAQRISHVGIVIDPKNKQFVHASSSRGVVVSSLKSKYYERRYAGARRIILP